MKKKAKKMSSAASIRKQKEACLDWVTCRVTALLEDAERAHGPMGVDTVLLVAFVEFSRVEGTKEAFDLLERMDSLLDAQINAKNKARKKK